VNRDLQESTEFMRDTLRATMDVARMPALWLPAVLLSVGSDMIVAAVNYPFHAGDPPPPERAITVMVLTILAKGWFSLTLCRIALAGIRGQATGVLNQWVSVQTALRVAAICLVLLGPILLGLLALIVPGVYLMVRWSQVVLLLIDEEAHGFDAVQASGALTAGYRPSLMMLLVAVGLVTALLEYLVGDITLLVWIYRALASIFGAALAAATYAELTRRAPWNAVA
jgi:hypothetical protein